jgi:hypothetical protein
MRTPTWATVLLCGLAPAAAHGQPGEPIRLTAAAPPVPSLRYRLLPDRSELVPGNAATGYYRALAMFVENQPLLQEIRKPYWSEWPGLAADKFPSAAARDKLALCRHILREVEIAARRLHCDWELDGRPEGFGLLLPDVQAFRFVATILAVKARVEMAEGQFDEACHTLQTGFALARHLGDGPTFIHVLVGAAIGGVMCRQIEAMAQRPNAPNLYWALTTLPRPFFRLDHALAEEATMAQRALPWLGKVENGPMTEEQVKTAGAETRKMLDDFQVRRPANDDDNRKVIMSGAYVLARRALVDQGMTAGQLDAMPQLQVVAIHALREYRLAHDEVAKWLSVRDGRLQPGFEQDARRFAEASGRLDLLFFYGLLKAVSDGYVPGVVNADRAVSRFDQRIAAQRCVQAIRAHAAAHGGKLPATLDEVTELPVPVDPALHKPFDYKANDANRATLSGAREPKGQVLSYELTLLPK